MMKDVGKWAAIVALVCVTAGCSIASRSDKFGADLDLGIGGIVSYIADVRLKASVGFSKTCKEEDHALPLRGSTDPFGDLLDFL